MAEVDLQGQQGELLANEKLVDPAATDAVLVAAAKLGDHSVFSELWTRHSNRVFNMAYRITGKREDAEDAIQDTLQPYQRRRKQWLTENSIYSPNFQ
jgi:RNA polymerase sigma-70 factor (ECF subfamily)